MCGALSPLCSGLGAGDGLLVDALRMGNSTRRMNHSSDDPNVVAKVVNHHGVRKVCMYAARLVRRGEELLFDYQATNKASRRQLPLFES